MSLDLKSPIGLIAGNGQLPLEFAEEAKKRGLKLAVLAHYGETDPLIEKFADSLLWIRVAQLGRMLKFLKKEGVKQVALAGGIKRVNLFKDLRPDLKALSIAAKVGTIKDDVILRAFAEELKKNSIEVISPNHLLPQTSPKAGYLTNARLTKENIHDGCVGWGAAEELGKLDVGQTVVVKDGIIVALEAVEGTDATILRGAELAGKGVTIVKLPKPQQDLRMDMPTIGPETIRIMRDLKADALIIKEGGVILLSPIECVELANKHKIVIFVAKTADDLK